MERETQKDAYRDTEIEIHKETHREIWVERLTD